jgi:transcription initiation factor IIF auxiliary subunit
LATEEKETIRRKLKMVEEEMRQAYETQTKMEDDLVRSKQILGDIVNMVGESRHGDLLEKITNLMIG